MMVMAVIVALAATTGVLQQALATWLVHRFMAAVRRDAPRHATLPPVTVLKPLAGCEPLLEEALARLCQQEYGPLQIVCGVQNARDPAIAVVRRVQARFPERDLTLVIDPTPHGRNRKVANLLNMYWAARHDILVIADSDVHAAPDYVTRLVLALDKPGIGVVTTLYAGLATSRSPASWLGASAITHGFLPGALLGRRLGREDCLGATMALRRATLTAIGGFEALQDHLADDHLLGTLVRRQGLRVGLAETVPSTTVPETRIADLFRHELRWGRTILKLVPGAFLASAIQYPLAWALLSLMVSGGEEWAFALFLFIWAARAVSCRVIDRALGLARQSMASPAPLWLLPSRDLLSLAVMLASYWSDRVEWRGSEMRAEPLPVPSARGVDLLGFGAERS